MGLDMKMRKKLISLGLAFGLTVTSVPLWQMPMTAQAAEKIVVLGAAARGETAEVTLDTVRAEAAEKYTTDQTGLDIDLSEQTFDGNTTLDYSTDADGRKYMQVFNKLLAGANDQTMIVRFKTNAENGLLFGAGATPPADDAAEKRSGTSTTLALSAGKLRPVFRNAENKGGLKGTFSSNLSDGQWHTVAISLLPSIGKKVDNVRLVIDGSTNLYTDTTTWGNDWIAGLNQRKDAPYTTFQIGGGAYVNQDSAKAAFNGEIDFITILDKAYTVEQLQKITEGDKSSYDDFSVMTAAGTNNTWLITGGTETVADFATSRTTRNYVGLFEETLRDGPGNPQYITRSRYVFNTAQRGADVAYILQNYDTMIKPYGTKAVGVQVGADDYSKGVEGLEAFKTNLRGLVEKIYADSKLPFIITPYPTGNAEEVENITAYTAAIQEVSAKRTRVIDVSELSNSYVENGSLTAAGHQTIANAIKDALGTGCKTNDTFDGLQDGSYTVAKKAADGSEEEVKSVTATEKSVSVTVAQETISGSTAKLSYVLTDESGQKVSGSAADGELTFTIDGLKGGIAYTLQVYDSSRKNDGSVKESYRPVEIVTAADASGTSKEYPDVNDTIYNEDVNEKLQALLSSEEPVTYLFMGDSITHGIRMDGYDNVPQLFAKYLDEQGRKRDVVLNTGVSNATLSTTLDQIDHRLNKYDPDVVMVMLCTNDASTRGEVVTNSETHTVAYQGTVSVSTIKDRYKQLVRAIYAKNPDACIVLRIPCDMIDDGYHTGFDQKYNAETGQVGLFYSIYQVAEEMKEEISDLNITVVNHLEEWRDYAANVRNNILTSGTGWLCKYDGVHPNGKGQVAMFQQIIKELGLYVPTSEMANYEYALDAWTGTSDIQAPVTQKATRASFAMSALSGYTNGLKNVTLTLTADGVSISRTAEYSANVTITLDGLDAEKTYTATVTGKDSTNSKEISFNASITKETEVTATEAEKKELTDSIEEAKTLDASVYPAAAYQAYEAALKKIEDELVKDSMTVAEVDEALTQVRLAKANLVKMAAEAAEAEAERKAAKADLEKALESTEAKYQAGKSDWTDASWNAYESAYQAARAADESTETAVLKDLLAKLKDAEENLEKKEPEKPSDDNPGQPTNPSQPTNPGQPTNPEQPIEEGKTYAEGDYSYKVTSTSRLTAEVTGTNKEGLTKITVYNTVKLGGKSYKVTSVGASAFKGNKKITSVSIGKNVQTIGKNAFAGCVKLKKVTAKSTKLKQIGSKAFFKCKALKSITIKSKTLKSVGKNAFKGINKKAVIKVPSAKLKAYRKTLAKKGQSKTVKIK